MALCATVFLGGTLGYADIADQPHRLLGSAAKVVAMTINAVINDAVVL
jgi:hypothetical protein